MKKHAIALCVLVFSAYVCSLCFAQIEIKAEVDKRKLSTAEDLVYKLIVSSSEKSLPQPVFPDFKGFYVVSSAHTSDISIKGKEAKIGAVYVFILVPKEAGKFTIGPAQVKTKTATYKTGSFEIEVLPAQPKEPVEPSEEKIIL